MRRSQSFGDTLRQAPADAEAAGHQLLIRGGYIQPLAAGIYSYLSWCASKTAPAATWCWR